MKLSTRGRYGIHAMYDLACNADAGPQPIKAIAERQAIPEAYLEQLFAVLKRDKLVTSVRGAQGGQLRLAGPGGQLGRELRLVFEDPAQTRRFLRERKTAPVHEGAFVLR